MKKFIKKLFRVIGPGVVTGASDDDPAGIATYSLAGAQFGMGFLWAAFLTTPLMLSVQELCGRLGMVGGNGIMSLVKRHYPKKILYGCIILLLLANVVNIGADIGAMAASMQMLTGLPFIVLALGMTLLSILLEVFLDYRTYSQYLKYLAFFLFTYIAVAFVIEIDWKSAFINTVIPSGTYSKEFFMMLTALLGTTISPYLFFWQASQEVEEEIAKGRKTVAARKGATSAEISDMRLDTSVGMIFSNVVMFFIILTAASTFAKNGIHTIDTADQAAQMLVPIAGKYAGWVFAAGIIGTGLLTIPVLAGSAAFAFSEMFGLHRGLSLKFHQARGFYGIIILSLLVGVAINFIGINAVKLLFYSALLNGLIAPVILILIFLVGNNEKIMGKWVSGSVSNVCVWLTILLMGFSGVSILLGMLV